MNKLTAILFVAILAVSSVFAQHNAPVTTDAQFDVNVILPLSWEQTADVILPDVIAGQTRNWAEADYPMAFILTGEPGYDVTITTNGPNAASGNPTATVSLIGTWDTPPTQLDATTGQATVTYKSTGIQSTDATNDHGAYSFELGVSAVYTAF